MIELDQCTRRYGERIALRKVTLELAAGKTLAVFGPNGAGKTTLLRILATLLRPHEGSARVFGAAVPRDGHAVRGRIGVLTHEPLLYRDLTARENLAFHARLHGVDRARVDTVLDAVDLAKRGDDPIRNLSRGMVQRIAIARTILHEPELLLLDEPVAGLDPKARQVIEPLIGRASGATRVVIWHDLETGLAEADLVLGLRNGQNVLLAEAHEVAVDDLKKLYA